MNRIHRLAALILTVLLCSCLSVGTCFAAVNPGNSYDLQYEHTAKVSARLTISNNGEAVCTGIIKANSSTSTVNIKLRLLKKNGSSWTPVRTWTQDDQRSSANLDKSCSVSAGTYKLVVSGSVTTTEGRTEFVSTSSSEKVYSNGSGGT